MKDIINLAVVNFNAFWGEKEKNLKRILSTRKAQENGAQI
jgi:predicted amidohydrolase